MKCRECGWDHLRQLSSALEAHARMRGESPQKTRFGVYASVDLTPEALAGVRRDMAGGASLEEALWSRVFLIVPLDVRRLIEGR